MKEVGCVQCVGVPSHSSNTLGLPGNSAAAVMRPGRGVGRFESCSLSGLGSEDARRAVSKEAAGVVFALLFGPDLDFVTRVGPECRRSLSVRDATPAPLVTDWPFPTWHKAERAPVLWT